MRRRTLLRRGAVVAALGLAGCSGGGNGTPTGAPETDTRSTTPTPGESTVSPSATATPTTSPSSTATDVSTDTPTPTATPLPSVDQDVVVGPGSLRFEPETFELPVGGTVRWRWESGGHNVKPSSVPNGADWTGTPGGEFATFDSGHTYTHTFDVAGEYEYYCAPHQSAGMTGSFTVG